jgi:hypothetical protein
MGESYTTILQPIDFFWVIGFIVAVFAFCLTARFSWIKPNVLLTFLLFKFTLCVGMSTWSLTKDLDFDSGGYYQRGQTQSILFKELVKGESMDYLEGTPFFGYEGHSTSRFDSLTGMLLALSGDSFMAAALTLCCLGATGQLLIFKYLRLRFPTISAGYFLLILFHPSSALWSGMLLKDSLGMLALGLLAYNADLLLISFRLRNFIGLALGLGLAVNFRSYIVVMFLVFLLFVFWDRKVGPVAARTARSGLAAVFYIYTAVMISVAFLFYYVRNYGADMVELQNSSNQVYGDIGGGSTFTNVAVSLSFEGVLAMPMGIINALLRPFIWEVNKFNQLLAAIENLIVVGLVLRGWFVYLQRLPRHEQKVVRSTIWGTTVMALVCAMGVGLFASNSGTISRYRTPLIPFFMAGPCVALGWRFRNGGGRRRVSGMARTASSSRLPARFPAYSEFPVQ